MPWIRQSDDTMGKSHRTSIQSTGTMIRGNGFVKQEIAEIRPWGRGNAVIGV
jgi:hypothetical protein